VFAIANVHSRSARSRKGERQPFADSWWKKPPGFSTKASVASPFMAWGVLFHLRARGPIRPGRRREKLNRTGGSNSHKIHSIANMKSS
jgi:hypothetical protein